MASVRLVRCSDPRTPAESRLILRMDKQLFPDDDRPETGQAHSQWWIAWEGDKPVGYCAVEYAGYADRGFLSRVGVLPRAGGKGLQRRFIRVRERYARSVGWAVMVTYVSRDNYPSLVNLLRCGYRLYRPAGEWGAKGALYLYRDL